MRTILLRVLAVFSALSWLVVPGFAVPDLLVTWDPDWPVMLEAGWALFSGVLVAAAFATVVARPRGCAPAIVLLWVATAALAVSTVVAAELPLLWLTVFLAAQATATTALVRSLPGAEPLRPTAARPSMPLVVLAVAGVGPWAAYALSMWEADLPIDVTMGIDHFAVQGALALALPVLAVLAAVWPRGRRYLGVSSGLAAGYLGLVSWACSSAVAGFGAVWSGLAVAWAIAVAVVAVGASAAVWVRRASTTQP